MPPKKTSDEVEEDVKQQIAFNVNRRIREPQKFGAQFEQDANEWLKDFERVSRYNRWDDEAKLASVVFALEESAKTWFENVEDEIRTWDLFMEAFAKKYDTSEVRRRNAEKDLHHRVQRPQESVMAYVEDVIKLCGKVKEAMPDIDVIHHLNKGIAWPILMSVFAAKIKKPSEYRKFVGDIDKTLNVRMDKGAFLTNYCLGEGLNYQPGLGDNNGSPMKSINSQQTASGSSIVAATSKPSIKSAGASTQGSDDDVVCVVNDDDDDIKEVCAIRQRRTEEFRTSDRTPVCFRCGRAGHVIKYCRMGQSLGRRSRERSQSPQWNNTPRYSQSVFPSGSSYVPFDQGGGPGRFNRNRSISRSSERGRTWSGN
jgi:hypothetical protein